MDPAETFGAGESGPASPRSGVLWRRGARSHGRMGCPPGDPLPRRFKRSRSAENTGPAAGSAGPPPVLQTPLQ